MIHRAMTPLGEPTAIAGMNIVVDLSDDGDVLLEIETQDPPYSDATLLKEFARFHTAHPDVLDEFLDTCRRKLDQGDRPRARQVLVHVRRQRFRQYGRGFLPLKNQYSSFYAALARLQGLRVVSDVGGDDVSEAIHDM